MSVSGRRSSQRVGRVFTLTLGLLGLAFLQTGRAEEQSADQQVQRLLASRCAVCHSTDLIQQQRLPRDRWEATVKKMVAWGAQLDATEEAMLAAYLATYFHPEAGPAVELPAPPRSGEEPATAPARIGVAGRGAALYKQNCLPCHGEAGSGGVGPKLSRNPILSQEDRFRATVSQGRGAMPPWGSVLQPQEIADIHAWLQMLK